MLGVVIWSNPQERKAVIWCEDHGDLAYFSDDSALMGNVDLDAGDLVDFEMTTERNLRRVHNPRLVSEHAYCGLDTQLRENDQVQQKTETAKPTATERRATQSSGLASVIPFSKGLSRRKSQRDQDKQVG